MRIAGLAAICQAGASLWILLVLLALLPRMGAVVTELGDPVKAAHAESQPLFWVSTSAVDLVFGVTILVFVLTLNGLLRAEPIVRIGTAVGLLAALAWAVATVLSVAEGSHLASQYASDPAGAAAAFTSTTAPGDLMVNVGRALQAIWLALLAWSALKTRMLLPSPLGYLSLAVAAGGLLGVVLPPARLLTALGIIAWGIWLGAVLIRRSRTVEVSQTAT
jgi:hypothetical protein